MRKSQRLLAHGLKQRESKAGKSSHDASVPDQEAEKDRHFVTALSRGLDILRCFKANARYLGNQEIAQATGLPKPTVSRLTYTLTKLGYLHYSAERGRYSLGAAMLPIARAYMAGLDVPGIARQYMQNLADELHATVSLGARERLSMVFLEVCHGGGMLAMRMEVGARVPHGHTAMGRAYLCVASLEEREELMAGYRRLAGQRWPEIKRSVEQSLQDYQRYGFCMLLGETYTDVYGVGVPLVSPVDGRIFAFNCGGPVQGITRRKLIGEIGPRLVAMRDLVLQRLASSRA